MNLEEMTIEQLQALAFRTIRDIEVLQNNRVKIIEMIEKKEKDALSNNN